jgi:hypothetical protein
MEPAKQLYIDETGRVVDEHLFHVMTISPAISSSVPATQRELVRRYNAHTAREQTLADVAELATQLARSLTNYNEAFALVRQIRAMLKKARESA